MPTLRRAGIPMLPIRDNALRKLIDQSRCLFFARAVHFSIFSPTASRWREASLVQYQHVSVSAVGSKARANFKGEAATCPAARRTSPLAALPELDPRRRRWRGGYRRVRSIATDSSMHVNSYVGSCNWKSLLIGSAVGLREGPTLGVWVHLSLNPAMGCM